MLEEVDFAFVKCQDKFLVPVRYHFQKWSTHGKDRAKHRSNANNIIIHQFKRAVAFLRAFCWPKITS